MQHYAANALQRDGNSVQIFSVRSFYFAGKAECVRIPEQVREQGAGHARKALICAGFMHGFEAGERSRREHFREMEPAAF